MPCHTPAAPADDNARDDSNRSSADAQAHAPAPGDAPAVAADVVLAWTPALGAELFAGVEMMRRTTAGR